ncbi:hypothetical protein ACWIGI_10535 [Nocardia sp. NPDC055321]
MIVSAFARRFAIVSESFHRFLERHTLTAVERHNLRAAGTGAAVYTASMGGHPRYR